MIVIGKNDQMAWDELSPEMQMIFLVDKPLNYTSFDVVAKLRTRFSSYFKKKRVKTGHAGTLDPLATGLLLIGAGKGTKAMYQLTGLDKSYVGTITLGGITPSYDLETPVEVVAGEVDVDKAELDRAVKQLTGVIQQVPPAFSAVKKDGVAAYRKARDGKQVLLEPRRVEVKSFEVELKERMVHFSITCSKGTYIRSIAHDLGQILGCGGYLSRLRRTKVGAYSVDHAFDLEELINILDDRTG